MRYESIRPEQVPSAEETRKVALFRMNAHRTTLLYLLDNSNWMKHAGETYELTIRNWAMLTAHEAFMAFRELREIA